MVILSTQHRAKLLKKSAPQKEPNTWLHFILSLTALQCHKNVSIYFLVQPAALRVCCSWFKAAIS